MLYGNFLEEKMDSFKNNPIPIDFRPSEIQTPIPSSIQIQIKKLDLLSWN